MRLLEKIAKNWRSNGKKKGREIESDGKKKWRKIETLNGKKKGREIESDGKKNRWEHKTGRETRQEVSLIG